MRILAIGAAMMGLGLIVPVLSNNGAFGPVNPIEAKARRDEAFLVAKGDEAMQAAYAQGRATLGKFLAVAENRPPNARAFSVKLPVRDGDKVEYFWIANFTRAGDRFRGTIDNTPRVVGNVRNGQEVGFGRADIVDWMYVQDGRMRGNFSACALIAKEERQAREAFMRKFGMDCGA